MANERTKASLTNVAGNLAYQATLAVSGFVIPQVLVRSFGSEINGLVASIAQFVSYFSLVEAGISGAAVYTLYEPLARGDWRRVSGVVSAARHFYYRSGVVFLALVGALMVGYSALLDHPGISLGSLVALIGALGAKGVLDFFTLAKYRVLITADQRAWVIAAASGVTTLLSVAIIAAVALSGGSVVLAYGAAVLPLALRSVALRIYTNRRYPEVDYSAPPEKTALEQRWDALYLQVLGSVQLGAPVILATVLLGDLRLVSVLSIYMLITSGIQLIIGVPANSLQASFGDVIVRGETATLQRAYRELEFIVHSTAAVVCGTAFVTISSFVTLYTADFADTQYVFPLLGFLAVLDVLLYHMKTPQGLMVISAGLYRATRWQTTIQGLIIVGGGIPLGLVWGLEGIVAAACLSDLYRTVDLLYFVPKHVTGLAAGQSVRRILLTLVAVSVICLPFGWVKFTAASLGGWLLGALGVAVWSMLVVSLLSYGFARPQMLGSLDRMRVLFGVRRYPDRGTSKAR